MSNVIEIGDFSVERKRRNHGYAEKGECLHRRTSMVPDGQYLTCRDCGRQVSAYWVLETLLDSYRTARDQIDQREKALADAREKSISLLAARTVEKAWRSKQMVPQCPHCRAGIFPTDRFGATMINKKIELAARAHRGTA